MRVRPMTAQDWPSVADIYAEGIAGGTATFEQTVPSWAGWDASHLPDHRFVAVSPSGQVLGWVGCSPYSGRAVYAGVVQLSVYVAAEAHGQGVGSALMRAVIDSTEAADIWTLQAGIFPANHASLALHAKHGFREVGRRERLGRAADGEWRDVVLLERRSATAGR